MVVGLILCLIFVFLSCSKRSEQERKRIVTKYSKQAQKELRKAERAVEDTAITAQIKAKFALDDEFKNADINVRTEKHLVYLTGKVKSEEIKKKAEKVARSAEGAVGVRNNIEVSTEIPEKVIE